MIELSSVDITDSIVVNTVLDANCLYVPLVSDNFVNSLELSINIDHQEY